MASSSSDSRVSRDPKGNPDNASTREAILDATAAIMVEEGYAAVTSRRVAERAGQKSKLVHYYFATMDDLFVAVYERSAAEYFQRHLQAVTSPNPLRALWELSSNPRRTRLSQEFIALSNHRSSVRKVTTRLVEQVNSLNIAFITQYLQESGADLEEFPPVVISKILVGLSRNLVNEGVQGVHDGHAEVQAFAERWIDRLEKMRRAADLKRVTAVGAMPR
jgi:TetR/AcrR family transcriptional regulator, regulator of autoinduction and epiphytic fitness